MYSKDELIRALKEIRSRGWIDNRRPRNSGGVGNTLEDLLGIKENNLPIPNSAEWELKCRRASTSSLTTLLHMEPSPRALKFVPQILLPKYGWAHETIPKEQSFRATISGSSYTDRGFRVVVDRGELKVLVSFSAKHADLRHGGWLKEVERLVGLGEFMPQPYWGFDELHHRLGSKILNCFYVEAETRRLGGREQFHYSVIKVLRGFSFDNFLAAVERGDVLVDFDARTGHNHGTKFRIRQTAFPTLYAEVAEV